MFYVFGMSKFECNYSAHIFILMHCYYPRMAIITATFTDNSSRRESNPCANNNIHGTEELHWNSAKHCEQTSLKLIEIYVKRIEWIYQKSFGSRHIICYALYHRFVCRIFHGLDFQVLLHFWILFINQILRITSFGFGAYKFNLMLGFVSTNGPHFDDITKNLGVFYILLYGMPNSVWR